MRSNQIQIDKRKSREGFYSGSPCFEATLGEYFSSLKNLGTNWVYFSHLYWILSAPVSFTTSCSLCTLLEFISQAYILPVPCSKAAKCTVLLPGAAHASKTCNSIKVASIRSIEHYLPTRISRGCQRSTHEGLLQKKMTPEVKIRANEELKA